MPQAYDQQPLNPDLLYDQNPDSIYRELGKRDSDRDLNADHFNIDLSPFNDGVNGYSFKVSASGVKSDIRRSGSIGADGMRGRRGGGGSGRDINWDAVWFSDIKILDNGWSAEMKIPYSAIRFAKDTTQIWGINFWREIKRYNEWSTWNFVDRKVGTSINHQGELTNLEGIEPPLP